MFKEKGFNLWLVGGAVRDMLLGRKNEDWDLASDASPEKIMAIFPRCIPTGLQHGTVTVLFKGNSYEITTLRIDGDYTDHRRPNSVLWTSDIQQDLARRDFTINAMAISLPDKNLLDPFMGQKDLALGLIRAVGRPTERFNEDALRLLRAFRFSAQLDFQIERQTLKAIPALATNLKYVSIERIQQEFSKILLAKSPGKTLEGLATFGLLNTFLPELEQCRGVEQRNRHRFDVFTHTVLATEAIQPIRLDLRLAALLHDIGKPACRAKSSSGSWTFYKHDEVSARMAKDILIRLRYSNAIIDKVVHLIREHMFFYEESWSDAALRRFIQRVGLEHLEDLFALRYADAYAIRALPLKTDPLKDLKARILNELKNNNALSLKDLAVNGEDLAKVGIEKGPWMGRVLQLLLETVIDSPEMNTEKALIKVAKELDRRKKAETN